MLLPLGARVTRHGRGLRLDPTHGTLDVEMVAPLVVERIERLPAKLAFERQLLLPLGTRIDQCRRLCLLFDLAHRRLEVREAVAPRLLARRAPPRRAPHCIAGRLAFFALSRMSFRSVCSSFMRMSPSIMLARSPMLSRFAAGGDPPDSKAAMAPTRTRSRGGTRSRLLVRSLKSWGFQASRSSSLPRDHAALHAGAGGLVHAPTIEPRALAPWATAAARGRRLDLPALRLGGARKGLASRCSRTLSTLRWFGRAATTRQRAGTS